MPLYICKCCDFSTKIKSHLTRHKNTKKHLANINTKNQESEFMVMSTNEHKMSTNEHKMSTNEHKRAQNEHKIFKYNCNYCESQFTTMANKRRHELHYCKNIDRKMDYQKLYKKAVKMPFWHLPGVVCETFEQ